MENFAGIERHPLTHRAVLLERGDDDEDSTEEGPTQAKKMRANSQN